MTAPRFCRSGAGSGRSDVEGKGRVQYCKEALVGEEANRGGGARSGRAVAAWAVVSTTVDVPVDGESSAEAERVLKGAHQSPVYLVVA